MTFFAVKSGGHFIFDISLGSVIKKHSQIGEDKFDSARRRKEL
jgi:hypothetical protein